MQITQFRQNNDILNKQLKSISVSTKTDEESLTNLVQQKRNSNTNHKSSRTTILSAPENFLSRNRRASDKSKQHHAL